MGLEPAHNITITLQRSIIDLQHNLCMYQLYNIMIYIIYRERDTYGQIPYNYHNILIIQDALQRGRLRHGGAGPLNMTKTTVPLH